MDTPSYYYIPRVVHCPGRVIHLLLLKLLNRPGALYDALAILARHALNTVSLTTTRSSCLPQDVVEVSIYVDFTDSKITLAELQTELKGYGFGGVIDVKVLEQQFPDVTVDELHFPVMMLDWRAIILREPVYGALFKGIREKFGSAGEAFLYHTGLEAGKGLSSDMERLGIDNADAPRFITLLELIHGRSLLDITTLDTDAKFAALIIHSSFECSLAGRQDKPYSAFYRGFLAGLFSGVINVKQVVETKCIAMGDPYCEFQLGTHERGENRQHTPSIQRIPARIR